VRTSSRARGQGSRSAREGSDSASSRRAATNVSISWVSSISICKVTRPAALPRAQFAHAGSGGHAASRGGGSCLPLRPQSAQDKLCAPADKLPIAVNGIDRSQARLETSRHSGQCNRTNSGRRRLLMPSTKQGILHTLGSGLPRRRFCICRPCCIDRTAASPLRCGETSE
jgi:hypothetical protein